MRDADIAIIGAGAAGVGAARALSGKGLTVVVLEASDRVGGRAWTHEAAGLPLDLGCGWLHSAERNPWVAVAEAEGRVVDRRPHAWNTQFRDLGFPPQDQRAARAAFAEWADRTERCDVASDRASDLIDPDNEWTPYVEALSGFINGAALDRLSVADYAAYDRAASDRNWRVPQGYGALVAASMPDDVTLTTGCPVKRVTTGAGGVVLETSRGSFAARAVIVTVSTSVLAGDSIRWEPMLDPWRQAAASVPLGANEKLFLKIVGPSPFETETHLIGDPHDVATGSYYIRPFGWPVIESFLGGQSAQRRTREGAEAAFAHAIDQLASLLGSSVRACLRPLVASDWCATPTIGGAYSHALPGHRAARATLARPFENMLFFAGEATHPTDFSTAHGALESGQRAAAEALAAIGYGRS